METRGGAWRRRRQITCLKLADLTLAGAILLASTYGAFAETVPQALRSDIAVRKLLVTLKPSVPPTRLVKDPRNNRLYYLKSSGDIYQVDVAAGTSSFIAGPNSHGLSITQGMTIGPDGTIYLVGNTDVAAGTKTQGTVVKGVLSTSGRVWSVLARTVAYPKSKTAYDHRLNGIIVAQSGSFVYVNSGARTDHGEVQSAGGLFPGVREVGLTACILKLPTSGNNILLQNDRNWLKGHGYIFAEGIRNTFDMAFDPDGNLFGTENGPDRDMADELNWLRPGLNYGFPWRIGGADNPQQFPDYNPATDRLLDPKFNAVQKGYYRNDPTFPPRPAVGLIEPIRNFGPDADSFRSADGVIHDASLLHTSISTFTAHRSPLGLVFDQTRTLAPEFRGHGFMLSWTKGDPTGDSAAGPFKDPGQDLLHLNLIKTATGYSLHATRIVGNFNNPIDSAMIGNKIYVIDYGGTQSIWEVTLPR